MKKLLLIVAMFMLSFSTYAQLKTPAPSPFSKVEQKVGLTDITIEYSRPGVKDRVIFGDLVPYGKVWRTGANARTKFTSSTDFTVDGQTVKAGSYSIFTIPNAESWEIIFYNDGKDRGTPSELKTEHIVAKTSAKVHPIPFNVETFTIDINSIKTSSANLEFIWEKTYVGIPFEVPTDNLVLANINDVMNGSPTSNDYYAAASYYFEEGKDIKQTKSWIDKAINMAGEKVGFWQLRKQALIYAKAGDKTEAITIAKKSLAAAKEAKNEAYVKMNTASLEEWGAM